jgi:hypothetical protein
MFDTYIHRHQHGPERVTVEEKRAPTDASVALLKDMEAAAKAKVVESIRLTDCPVEAVVHRHNDPMDCRSFVSIHYSINGRKRKCMVEMDWDAKLMDQLDKVWKALGEDIAALLMEHHAKTIVRGM